MASFNHEVLKLKLEREEVILDKVISYTPIILVCAMLIWRQFIYDFSFSLQDPLPEYSQFFRVRRGIPAFTRQTILESLYFVALFYILTPSRNKESTGKLCTINETSAAWIYRIGFLVGEVLLALIGYIVIRIAFHNKLHYTHNQSDGSITVYLILIVVTLAVTILIHEILVP